MGRGFHSPIDNNVFLKVYYDIFLASIVILDTKNDYLHESEEKDFVFSRASMVLRNQARCIQIYVSPSF